MRRLLLESLYLVTVSPLLLMVTPLPCPAQDTKTIRISGYVKNFSMVFDRSEVMENGD